jgi:hypothetical protein
MLERKEEIARQSTSNSSSPVDIHTKDTVNIFEKLIGTAYSELGKKHLLELKHLYADALQMPAPIFWDLDANDCPTHKIKSQKWSNYVRQIAQGKESVGHFYYQSSLIVDNAETYLLIREKRWIAGGYSGDLLQQFMAEWIHFAINDLPTWSFDEHSIARLQQRLLYLEKVQKHESLFKFGIIFRERNKFDTMESIKLQLVAAINLASKEALRECAREKFYNCRTRIERILLACVRLLYYARLTPVANEPLELQGFIGSDTCFLTGVAKELYPKIKATHTGAMLAEIISLTGLDAFGVAPQQTNELNETYYFDLQCRSRSMVWDLKKADLPGWIAADVINESLNDFKAVGESILRIARLKILVEQAHYLTGKKGDEWAYGDQQGRLSVEALLFLLENEIDLLKKVFFKIYTMHNENRHAYTLKNRINSNNDVNLNFNRVDFQKTDFAALYTDLKLDIKTIREQMVKFAETEANRTSDVKRDFYLSLVEYFKLFHPQYYLQFKGLEKPATDVGKFSLEGYFGQVKNKDYQQWRRKHFSGSLGFYPLLEVFENKYSQQLENPDNADSIQHEATNLQDFIQFLYRRIKVDRPAWRIDSFSLGWPFFPEIHRYFDILAHDLTTLSRRVMPRQEQALGQRNFLTRCNSTLFSRVTVPAPPTPIEDKHLDIASFLASP